MRRVGLRHERLTFWQRALRAAFSGLLLGLFLSACMVVGVLVLVVAGVL